MWEGEKTTSVALDNDIQDEPRNFQRTSKNILEVLPKLRAERGYQYKQNIADLLKKKKNIARSKSGHKIRKIKSLRSKQDRTTLGKSCSSCHFEVGESDCFVIAGQRKSTLTPDFCTSEACASVRTTRHEARISSA